MSIFDKSITALSTADLQELLEQQAVENIRLEFKSIDPPKDEMLKKLSSLANTYGGYTVVGAAADGAGKLQALPGVAPINGYRQRIVQWCYDSVWPPLEVFVSDPIPTPQDATKVCYVIEVPLSAETPHFLNGRNGAYVRTDEFSQRFEPRLASWEELTHLGNRRAALVQRREALNRRSIERFNAYVKNDYAKAKNTTGGIGATLYVTVTPQFPIRHLIEHGALLTQFTPHHINWRQSGFPAPNKPKITAHESMLIPGAGYRFSLLEITVWGHVFYAVELDDLYQDAQKGAQVRGIHSTALVGYLLVFLEHASSVLKLLGYDGPLIVQVQMVRIHGIPLVWFPNNTPKEVGAAHFDDALSLEVSTSSAALSNDRDNVVGELAKTIFLALNWSAPALGPDAVKQIIERGYDYNFLLK